MTCADPRAALRGLTLAIALGAVTLAGCGGAPASSSASANPTASATPAPSVALVTVGGIATAGPTCPVVTPSASDCLDRPVPGAVIVVRANAAGPELIRVVTDAQGNFEVVLVPGRYVLEPQPVEGLMGTAQPVTIDLREGQRPDPIVLAYDTGIR